jgi:uncharacterized protein
MNDEVMSILRECADTASWFGIEIVDLAQRNLCGDTPLHTVCSWGRLQPARVLLEAGADVNAIGDQRCTPIFNAIIGGNPEVVALLRARGARVDVKAAHGWTPAEYARRIQASADVLSALK